MSAHVFVVIVTYNGTKWITPCFSSLRRSTIPLKTVVIDNGSSDETVARIQSEFPEVELLNTGKNLGFGKANNIGMEMAYRAGADYVFLLNQDAWIDPDAIEKIVRLHEQHPECGIISPMHLNGAGDALDYNFSTYIAPEKCKDLVSDLFLDRQRDLYPVPFVNAAAWSMTRRCLEVVGGFSPSFFHYGEDDNYAMRLQFHRLTMGVTPLSRIYHDRENRGTSKFFDEDISYRRDLIRQGSNPNQGFSFARELGSVLASLFAALLLLRRWQLRTAWMKLKVLSSLDKDAVVDVREKSKQQQGAFLDLHGA